jgi:hypothetical protein
MSDAVNREWLYLRGGQQLGPVSLTELQQLAATGQIQPQDNVWKAGMAQWAPAQTIPGLFVSAPPPPPPPVPPIPPVNASPDVVVPVLAHSSNGIRLAVLIMTIVSAFLSVFVGGCTASVGEGFAHMGEGLSEFQNHGDASKTRRDAAKMRKDAGSFAGWGILQGVLGLAGGIWAYRNFTVAKGLYWGGGAILIAAVISMHNLCSFFTAGVLDTIAGILTLIRARSLHAGK